MKLIAPSRISRRLGERFFFKAERDATAKSASVRRPYPPGMHSKRRRRTSSEFGIELAEKQKLRYSYGLSDGAMKSVVARAIRRAGKQKTRTAALIELLELRLDNAVWRMGLASSRRIARQLVSHGHILVNGRRVTASSMLLKPGDTVSIRAASRSNPVFDGLEIKMKKYQPPEWVRLDPEAASGTVARLPREEDALTSYNLPKVIEYYSR